MFFVVVASVLSGVPRLQVGIARSVHAPLASVAEYHNSAAQRPVSFRLPVSFAFTVFQPLKFAVRPACKLVVAGVIVSRQRILYLHEGGC